MRALKGFNNQKEGIKQSSFCINIVSIMSSNFNKFPLTFSLQTLYFDTFISCLTRFPTNKIAKKIRKKSYSFLNYSPQVSPIPNNFFQQGGMERGLLSLSFQDITAS